MKTPKEDQAVITPANGFYLCRPLKVADLIVPVKISMPEMLEKIKALSMSQILAIWQPADAKQVENHSRNDTEIPEYTVGEVIIHREQGQNTFQAYASSRPLIFVHHTMVMGQIEGLDVKPERTNKP